MFTINQIELAHSKIKSGAEFPKYIAEIKEIGVTAFETWVIDSHTVYYGKYDFKTNSNPKYEELNINNQHNKNKFIEFLKIHQKGETDYLTFCKHCAETGIEKWIVNLQDMTCTYYNKRHEAVLVEIIPTA